MEQKELARSPTVDPVPDVIMVDGGLLISTEGMTNTSGLQLGEDGTTVLIPQPTDHEGDCLNWSSTRKHLLLVTIAWGALCADFIGAIGSAPIMFQSIEWGLSLDKTNQPNSIVVLLLGLFGLVWVPMTTYWGRAPVLFWTEVLGFAFTLGTALSKDYNTFFAMRALSAVFLTAAQTISIAFLKDMFFFHERTRKIGLWACLYICSPYIGPMLGNFVVGKTHNWHDPYWMCVGVIGLQIVLVILFVDETWFNREIPSQQQPPRPQNFGARMMRVLGFWQIANQSYFPSLKDAYRSLIVIILQPHFALICISYFLSFMWAIGINVTTSIIFGTPIEFGGYGYNNINLGWLHWSPIVGIVVAEFFGHYFNDFLARQYVHKHDGIFEPEVRLWPIYISAGFSVPGIILVGQSIHHHLPVAGVAFGWGMYGLGVMLSSVAVTAYSLDSFPMAPAEVAAWLNLARTIGGFAVGYFQQPWGAKSGFDVSFGIQSVIVAVSLIPIAVVHQYGHKMRLSTAKKYQTGL
ncbi:major facilitator superfamily domain-containing protein [Leptodontidium sp. 2 PMI_412]|nr:major facilitator superfamily domain-containing protein [Leptodontidium sp. 2 PMI_412]